MCPALAVSESSSDWRNVARTPHGITPGSDMEQFLIQYVCALAPAMKNDKGETSWLPVHSLPLQGSITVSEKWPFCFLADLHRQQMQ